MRRWIGLSILLIFVVIMGLVVWQGYTGYRNYHRAVATIEAIVDPDMREEAWSEFQLVDQVVSVGSFMPARRRITVWSSSKK